MNPKLETAVLDLARLLRETPFNATHRGPGGYIWEVLAREGDTVWYRVAGDQSALRRVDKNTFYLLYSPL